MSFVPSMLRAAVKLPFPYAFRLSSSRGSGPVWVDDPALAFYPGSRAGARPPETVQSQSGHRSGGTSFVAVAARPYTNRTRRARAAYTPFTIAPSGTIPAVT